MRQERRRPAYIANMDDVDVAALCRDQATNDTAEFST
jgi:hypothetical protein